MYKTTSYMGKYKNEEKDGGREGEEVLLGINKCFAEA